MYYDITHTVLRRRVVLGMRGDILAGSGHTPQLEHYYWLHRAVPKVSRGTMPWWLVVFFRINLTAQVLASTGSYK